MDGLTSSEVLTNFDLFGIGDRWGWPVSRDSAQNKRQGSKRTDVDMEISIKMCPRLLCWILSLLLSAQMLHSQSRPEADLFPEGGACLAYERFLDGVSVGDTSGCHPLSAILIDASGLGIAKFLRTYAAKVSPRSSIGLLVAAESEVVLGDPERAYLALDLADRAIFSALGQAGDNTRARFYASVMSNLKADAIKGLCKASGGQCSKLSGTEDTSRILRDTEFLQDVWPGTIFLCLLRVDSFRVPVSRVVGSIKFKECISGEGRR